MIEQRTVEKSSRGQALDSFSLPAPHGGVVQGRNQAIDFVRGLLVLSMVVYHSLNYTISDSPLFSYLRYIALGFIFASGFVVTRILFYKYEASKGVLFRKLIVKGVKLILLFTIVNIAISVVFGKDASASSLGLRGFIENILSIYLTGNSTRAAFEILVPIGYLMLVSPLILIGVRVCRLMPYFFLGAVGACCILGSLSGSPTANGALLVTGMCGLIIGTYPSKWLDFSSLLMKVVVLGSLGIYIGLASIFPPVFFLNLFGTFSVLAAMWMVGNMVSHTNVIVLQIDLLGRHSLFAYMIQIAILQLIVRLSHHQVVSFGIFALTFLEALVLTVASVVLLSRLIRLSRAVRMIYAFIFS